MHSRKATKREAAVLARLDRLVVAQVRAIAPPAERKPLADFLLSDRQRSALSGFTAAQVDRIEAVLARLPPVPTSFDVGNALVPAPPGASQRGVARRQVCCARSARPDQG